MECTNIQSWIFKKVGDNINYLILKRIPKKGGFWQPITGRIEKGEAPLDAAKREVKEETGINTIVRAIENVHEFVLEENPNAKEVAFAFEVEPEINVLLDVNIYPEHEDLRWGEYEEVSELLKWQQNKEALRKLNELLNKEK